MLYYLGACPRLTGTTAQRGGEAALPAPATHKEVWCFQRLQLAAVPFHRVSRSFCFWAAVKLVGNLTLYFTMKSPLWPGFLEIGMPWEG